MSVDPLNVTYIGHNTTATTHAVTTTTTTTTTATSSSGFVGTLTHTVSPAISSFVSSMMYAGIAGVVIIIVFAFFIFRHRLLGGGGGGQGLLVIAISPDGRYKTLRAREMIAPNRYIVRGPGSITAVIVDPQHILFPSEPNKPPLIFAISTSTLVFGPGGNTVMTSIDPNTVIDYSMLTSYIKGRSGRGTVEVGDVFKTIVEQLRQGYNMDIKLTDPAYNITISYSLDLRSFVNTMVGEFHDFISSFVQGIHDQFQATNEVAKLLERITHATWASWAGRSRFLFTMAIVIAIIMAFLYLMLSMHII